MTSKTSTSETSESQDKQQAEQPTSAEQTPEEVAQPPESSNDALDEQAPAEDEEVSEEASDMQTPDDVGDATDDEVEPSKQPPKPPLLALGSLALYLETLKPLWKDRLLVTALALLVFLPMLGSFGGLWDPWETHYGEVARMITERNDWISTWWGSLWTDGNGHREGNYFFSKPILLMWSMAMGMTVFGVNEWGIRIGVCLIGVLGLVSVFAMGRSVFNKRTGYLMALVLGTSPFYFMLSRQAQTDMPFVGMMTVGLAFFMMAVFGRDRNEPADQFSYGLTFSWLGVLTIPQLFLLIVGLSRWRGDAASLFGKIINKPTQGVIISSVLLGIAALLFIAAIWFRFKSDQTKHKRANKLAFASLAALWLPLLIGLVLSLIGGHAGRNLYGWFVWSGTQVAIYATCFGLATYLTLARPVVERRRLYLYLFYAFIGLATLAKGLLGFMLPGAILFFYILLTREWRLLKRVELLNGTLIFVAVSFPWYAAMLIRHPHGFWNRFFVHDHFKRLASGVHAVDEGSFEHFIRWLGYGLFPWTAMLPPALGRLFVQDEALSKPSDQARATLMLVIWATFALTLFTLSSTKFHHYIFPALPPLSLLVALSLSDLWESKWLRAWPLYIAGLGVLGVLAWDIMIDPQSLKNLFTYKYDRKWFDPTLNTTFRWVMLGVCAPMALGVMLLLWRTVKMRVVSFALMFISTIVFTYFTMNVYMGWYSDAWSQKELWDTYKSYCTKVDAPPGADRRKPYCKQPPVAYKLNWRGETFYTHNLVVPIRDDDDFRYFIKQNKNDGFFAMMEMPRYNGEFKRKLPGKLRGKSCVVYNRNQRYILVKVPCASNDPQRIKGALKRTVRTSKDQQGGLAK